MAASKVSMKLLIDKQTQKVLFAEAGKDTVDFLFNLLALPVVNVISLLTKQQMVGCIGNLYESVESLGQEYFQPNQNKDTLLKPKSLVCSVNVPLLKLDNTPAAATVKTFYKCSSNASHHNYVTDNFRAICPACGYASMTTAVTYVAGGAPQGEVSAAPGGGFVKGVVTYMVMDNLVVKPMSTISSITLLNKFNVKDVGALEEKMVDLDMSKALKLLKKSMCSKAVLTGVFLGTS